MMTRIVQKRPMYSVMTDGVCRFQHLRQWLFVAITLLLVYPALGDELANDTRVDDAIHLLDRWLDARQAYEQIPGFSIAVVYNQDLLWAKGYGKSDIESNIPATANTVYSICSITKLFTSVAVMRAIEESEVELNTPIVDLLPWFARDNSTAEIRQITVFDLLTHSAGYKLDIGRPPEIRPYLYNPTQAEFRELVRDEPLRREPGTQYFYSNIGFGLLGEIVESLSGKTYAEYVQDEILDPIGLRFTIPEIGDIPAAWNLAVGYGPPMRGGGRTRVGTFRGDGFIAAKGFASTVVELARFSKWQFRLLNGNDELLRSDVFQKMIRPQFVDAVTGDVSGLGFAIYETETGTFVGHGGDCPGFRSDLLIEPDERLAVAAVANGMDPVWEFTAMAHELLAPAIKDALANPGKDRKTPIEFERYFGTYQGFPWSGEWQVIPWLGSLAIIYLPTDDPQQSLRRLRHIENGRFRVIDEDGEPGMTVTFEADEHGEIIRMRTSEYPRKKLN